MHTSVRPRQTSSCAADVGVRVLRGPDSARSSERSGLTVADLQRGLDDNQLVLHYQPMVDLDRDLVVGVEALVRWQHPEGLRMPDTFIPLAEASRLIVPLGAWVLDEACRQAAAWRQAGLHLDMAVNLSMHQLAGHDIAAVITATLRRAGLEPARLLVEVTESAAMKDAAGARVSLDDIKALGCRVAIDDFGTGYSSLLYLKRYPVSALKVDRSFVAGLGLDPADDAIVASIIGLARGVGADSIAEGVETVEQLAVLRALGCGYAQGFLFAPPVPAEDLPAVIVGAQQALSASRRGPTTRPKLHAMPGVVDRIKQLRQLGASAHTIAAALNREHAPNPHGVRWHSVSVDQAARGWPIAPLRGDNRRVS